MLLAYTAIYECCFQSYYCTEKVDSFTVGDGRYTSSCVCMQCAQALHVRHRPLVICYMFNYASYTMYADNAVIRNYC